MNNKHVDNESAFGQAGAKAKMLAISGVTALCLAASPAGAKINLVKTDDGSSADMMGLVSVWGGTTDRDEFGDGSGAGEERSTRVMTGFQPSKLEFVAKLPTYNGLNVSTYFQIATSIQGSNTKRTGEQIEIRGAELRVDTSVGRFSAGRNWNIFSSSAILNDTASIRGVGYNCVGPDGAGPNCGRIGTGYSWTDFAAGFQYASPNISGFRLRAGVFDPIETAFGQPGGAAPFVLDGGFSPFNNVTDIDRGTGQVETDEPRFEGEITYRTQIPVAAGQDLGVTAWAGGLRQKVQDNTSNDTTNILGYNFGGRLSLAGLNLTGNYGEHRGMAEGFQGFGVVCNGTECDAVKSDSWYVGLDYTVPGMAMDLSSGPTIIGASYGEGEDESNSVVGNDNVEREQFMVFVRHMITPTTDVKFEFSSFERSTDGDGVPAGIFQPQEDYNQFMVGTSVVF